MEGSGNGGDAANSGKHVARQVCQICGDGVGTAADGELFTACDVCGFPVCRPCYEYERKDGTQACPRCKTKYKRHKGSPPVHGEETEDVDADDASDYNHQASGNQDQKQKIAERMLTWRTNSRGSDIGLAKYDSGEIGHGKYDSGEIPRGYIPSLTHSQISGEIPGASPDHMMSPVGNIGRRGHQFPYVNHSPNPSREFSGSLGNVAWKERVDGWKMKDKGAIPMTNGTSIAPSEGRRLDDIDASTDYNMEDALLLQVLHVRATRARGMAMAGKLHPEAAGARSTMTEVELTNDYRLQNDITASDATGRSLLANRAARARVYQICLFLLMILASSKQVLSSAEANEIGSCRSDLTSVATLSCVDPNGNTRPPSVSCCKALLYAIDHLPTTNESGACCLCRYLSKRYTIHAVALATSYVVCQGKDSRIVMAWSSPPLNCYTVCRRRSAYGVGTMGTPVVNDFPDLGAHSGYFKMLLWIAILGAAAFCIMIFICFWRHRPIPLSLKNQNQGLPSEIRDDKRRASGKKSLAHRRISPSRDSPNG